MRHRVDGRKLGRTSAHRKALWANMTSSLIMHEKIETTLPKAKELRRVADRLVTLGKQKSLHARRRAIAITRNPDAVHKLFDVLASRFATRNGGYTRIYKLGNRHGDNAPMCLIEYLPVEGGEGASLESTGKKGAKKAPVAKKKAAVPRKAPAKKAAAKPAAKKKAKKEE